MNRNRGDAMAGGITGRYGAQMRLIACLMAAVVSSVASAAVDFRPPIDKSGLKRKVWMEANTWFDFDMSPTLSLGGPNVPWRKYEGEGVWAQGLEDVSRYGVDAVLFDAYGPGSIAPWAKIVKEVRRRNLAMPIGMFTGFYSNTPDRAIEDTKKAFSPYREVLASDPGVLRIGGAPVMHVYTPARFKPEEWKRIFDALDAEFGRMVYLLCYSSLNCSFYGDFEKKLREYLSYFDGVTSYAFSMEDMAVQRKELAVLEKVMKECPGKIYVGGPFAGYFQHYSPAGLEARLSSDWRESVDLWLGSSADAIQISNLFDHYENSLVLPCYEREDLLLRYLEYALSKWRGSPFRKEKQPELVLCNYQAALVGWRSLDFEVLGFPIDSEAMGVEFRVELCDTAGKVLRRLDSRKMRLDAFHSERFSVPSEDFVDERGVVPRLVYTWKGREHVMPYNPMTVIEPAQVSYRLYWARSSKNALDVVGGGEWSIDGVGPGGTVVPQVAGVSVFDSRIKAKDGDGVRNGYFRHVVKRDGAEFFSLKNKRLQLACELALALPNPRGSLHWYNLEIENRLGRRYQTLPIWNTDGSRSHKVDVPLLDSTGRIFVHGVEEARIPFYFYPCDRDSGRVIVDMSGYEHHGIVNGKGFGGGHHDYTGYNHLHNGPVAVDGRRLFRCDDGDGTGYYRLEGNDALMFMGATAMPGAGTYEVSVRPASLGQNAGILSSGRGHVALDLTPDGRVKLSRRQVANRKTLEWKRNECLSKSTLPVGRWTRLAVVYDLREMRLYFNGSLEATMAASPNFFPEGFGKTHRPFHSDEFIGNMLIGAACRQPYTPERQFKGDVRRIRVTGRNLTPEEFLP